MTHPIRKRTHSFKCVECGNAAGCYVTIMSAVSHYEPEAIKCPFLVQEAQFKVI